jgi:hypothetical protein
MTGKLGRAQAARMWPRSQAVNESNARAREAASSR